VGIFASGDRRDGEAFGFFGLEVFETVNGEIDGVIEECFFDSAYETADGPILVEGVVLGGVAMSFDDCFFDHDGGMSFAQQIAEPAGLSKGEIATACSESKGGHFRIPMRRRFLSDGVRVVANTL